MSSLLKEELKKRLFWPEGQILKDFIEIEEPVQCRHFLCVSVLKNKEVQLSVVQCQKRQPSDPKRLQRSHFVDIYQKIEVWPLEDLVLLDGRNPDIGGQLCCKVLPCTYSGCPKQLTLPVPLTLKNFDQNYIQPAFVCSDQGDCTVLMKVCFYAVNLVWLSMCPAP